MKIDAGVIKKIKNNDRKVILELYQHSFNVLMSAAVRYKNNEVDQKTIVNNAFLKVINNIEKYKPGTAYFSWVKRIVQNEIIDDFRRNKKYKETFTFDETDYQYEDDVHAEIDYEIEAEALQNILDQLPPATKLVFNLYAIEGFKNKEICEKLDLKYETVKWHIKEARKKLREMLSIELKKA